MIRPEHKIISRMMYLVANVSKQGHFVMDFCSSTLSTARVWLMVPINRRFIRYEMDTESVEPSEPYLDETYSQKLLNTLLDWTADEEVLVVAKTCVTTKDSINAKRTKDACLKPPGIPPVPIILVYLPQYMLISNYDYTTLRRQKDITMSKWTQKYVYVSMFHYLDRRELCFPSRELFASLF